MVKLVEQMLGGVVRSGVDSRVSVAEMHSLGQRKALGGTIAKSVLYKTGFVVPFVLPA